MKLLDIIVQTFNDTALVSKRTNSELRSAVTAKSFAPFYESLAFLSANEYYFFLRGKKIIVLFLHSLKLKHQLCIKNKE